MYRLLRYDNRIKAIQECHDDLFYELCQDLRDHGISAQRSLVGSARRHMILQNENEPIDFDYNLNIQSCQDIYDCFRIKETVRHVLDDILVNECGLRNCQDSTSALTGREMYLKKYPDTVFTFDLCIVTRLDDGKWYRLINHKETYGNMIVEARRNEYVWERMPDQKNVYRKLREIEAKNQDRLIVDEYVKIKNKYLVNGDYDHPSYVCYFEAINNVYNHLRQTGAIKS